MKKNLFLFIIILGTFLINACEKDDICVDGDTPLLVLRFYDAEDTAALKSVSNLRILGAGQESPVNTFADRATVDSVAIPLRADQSTTQFYIILDSSDENDLETGNIDTLDFAYTVEEIFVSRACGFIANYNDLTPQLTTGPENWIQSIEVVDTTVTNQFSAHVKIFH
ncbi:DUF6452 family protein [Lentiprolixibacter aurantiacus]|uniref:DUF6452 family protein n=1 Tax=Lentiprolixibacter aurantiacus TaxID=2993939 RepID=A0AAE3MLG3_9FLAO|nr:DUF6452 family protein [Lentiprolixibacter aurantiacus]MCX2719348.1 DUF6452 family protein [Lentiprolixibacter aurantiacus]